MRSYTVPIESYIPTRELNFPTWGEFVEYASQPKPRNAHNDSSIQRSEEWTLTANYDAAVSLALTGWESAAIESQKISNAIVNRISSMIEVPQLRFDVEGIGIDIDRFNRHDPEDWFYFQDRLEENSGDVVTIVVNGFVSCGIDTATIVKRGAIITALVELLELGGKKVKVVHVTPFNKTVHVTVTLKEAQHPLDVSRLLFATAHPSMFRRLNFRCLELQTDLHPSVHNYGSPIDLSSDKQGDIYFGKTSYDDRALWADPEEWITRQLQAQGVTLTLAKSTV